MNHVGNVVAIIDRLLDQLVQFLPLDHLEGLNPESKSSARNW